MQIRLYVDFFSPPDLARAVEVARGLGGTQFLGVGRNRGRVFAVFETELASEDFLGELMGGGSKVNTAIEQTSTSLRGIVPLVLACEKCGREFSYVRGYSNTGRRLCDGCLAELIEQEPEVDDGGD